MEAAVPTGLPDSITADVEAMVESMRIEVP